MFSLGCIVMEVAIQKLVVLIQLLRHQRCVEETAFVDDASLWDGHGAKDATQLSKGYSIQTNANFVYLYIPTHKIKNFNNYERVIVAIQYIYNGNQSYKTNISYIIGDYLVTKVYIRDYQDIRFTLLGEK